jgi:hypothetical protein
MHQAEKIIFHGLFEIKVVQVLWAMPWLLKKSYWVIWGGDLYTYQFGDKNWKWNIKEFFRRPVIKKMGHLVTGTPGDVELARQWYDANGKHLTCFNYPSNVYKILPEIENEKESTNILVGNSADPSNNYIAIFGRLKKNVNDKCKIYCPLSYGDMSYAAKVIENGEGLFGDRFLPIRKFMEFDDYMRLLASVDVAIFDHPRQQAFGNIISLLGFGKKVYINPVSTLNSVFGQYGITVYDSKSIDLSPIDPAVADKNRARVEEFFSKQALVDSLNKWIK